MRWKERIRFALASIIVFTWMYVEFRYGRIKDPTLELRLIILGSIIVMFGETAVDKALEIINRDE